MDLTCRNANTSRVKTGKGFRKSVVELEGQQVGYSSVPKVVVEITQEALPLFSRHLANLFEHGLPQNCSFGALPVKQAE